MATVARAPAPPLSRLARVEPVLGVTAATVLALLLAFVVWPVVRVLALSVAGPRGLAQYAAFFSSWRLARILVNSLLVSAVSTLITVAVAVVLAYAVTRTTVPGKRFVSLMSLLPLISPPFIVSILCMTDFGNPILIGGRYNVLATEIYAQVIGMNDFPAAAVMSVVLLVPCLAAYVANTKVVGRRSYVTLSAGARTTLRPTPPAVRWSLFAVSLAIALAIAGIYALIPIGSLVRLWGSDWSLSLAHYRFDSTAEGAWPIAHSVKLALLSGIIGTVLALVTAYVIERRRPPGARVIEALSLLPAALPGTVIGVGYILAFNVPPLLLTGTVWILVTSVVFWKFPVAVLAAINTLKQIDPAIEEAAVSLGAGSVRTFARVVIPLLTGAAFSIFIYFFVNGMVTVSAVIFLIYPGFNLGSVAILAQVENGYPGVACALGTIILAIVIGAVLLLRALVGGDRVAILKS